MKTLKIMFKTALAALAVMAAFACDKDPDGKGSALNEALELTVDVEDITFTSAKVKVTHDGEKSDTWYGFLTEDVEGDEDSLITAAVEAYMDGESSEGLRKSKSYVKVLKDLKPGVAYKYIAFGLSSEGEVYGTSASAEFVTIPSDSPAPELGDPAVDGMTVNPAWTVNYVGKGVLYEEEYDHVVTVNSTDRNTYAITIVYASLWNLDDLYDMAVLFAEDLVAYVDEFNEYYGTSYTVAEALYSGTASDAFDLDPGYYMAVALGITEEGKVSGYYAVSDVFEVKEAVPTENYKSWLGDWTVVGENKVAFDITISRHVNNKSFWVYGWEGFQDIPIDVEYSEDRNDITFYSQLVAENYYIESLDLTANMYFLGGDEDNNFYTNTDGDYGIAIAGVLEGGQRALVRYGVNMQGYPKFTTMFYAAEIGGEYSFFTETEQLPSFRGIAEFNPKAAVTTAARAASCKKKPYVLPMKGLKR